jgi:uncharacterized protein (TIGR02231 family)
MIRLFAFALLCTTSFNSAIAAEFSFSSDVDEVTVFPQGASVMRLASGSVPAGDHVIIIGNLPQDVIADSVRVKGVSAGKIFQNSVDVKQIAVRDDAQPAERLRLERQIEELQGENRRLDRRLSDNDLQRQLLQGIASRAMVPTRDENGAMVLSGAALTQLLESTAAKLDALGESEANSLARQRDIAREVEALQVAIGELAPRNRIETIVSINVAAETAGEAKFEIEYKIDQAGWQPVYDANLTLGETTKGAMLDLKRLAQVRNGSGESWDNVQLALSTARPSSGTSAPTLSPFEIDEIQMGYLRSKEQGKVDGLTMLDAAAPASTMKNEADAAPIEEQKVVVDYGGFQAVFAISGRTSIENTGEVKSVAIDTRQFAVDLYVSSVPRLDPAAYLVAGFELDGKTPLLPGIVQLSRDGVFIGRGQLPMISSGEKHELGFGVDDQIKISQVETSKRKGEVGFVSTAHSEERQYLTSVENLHDFPIKVAVLDRLPVSNHEDIVVSMSQDTTVPTRRNVDDQRGILEWANLVPAWGKQEIVFGYEVQWPKNMNVNLLN